MTAKDRLPNPDTAKPNCYNEQQQILYLIANTLQLQQFHAPLLHTWHAKDLWRVPLQQIAAVD